MLYTLFISGLLAARTLAQTTLSATASTSSSPTSTQSLISESASVTLATISGGRTASLSLVANGSASVPTGSYMSYTTTRLLGTSSSSSANNGSASGLSNGTTTRSSSTSTSLLLVGTGRSSSGTATRSVVAPTNTQACNNYPELCNRKYSNITEVCAHNSAFSIASNVFSNQDISITGMLNDGIRMIQGETHRVNNTMYSCHTSCDLLNAGTYESELRQVREWMDANPYEVVTFLIVNSDYVHVGNYTAPFTNSGMLKYVYTPPKVPMNIGDWPTLAELILMGKRAIVFMDYEADQNVVPYIVDQFSAFFETPFSPTDPAFPCTAQRPPGISREDAEQKLYLANHNLNVEFSLLGQEILIPDFANIATINGVTGPSSLETMAQTCVADWGRPPSFLLVDFYNEGTYTMNGRTMNGSVFEVAARMNGLTYNRPCCGGELSITNIGGRNAVSVYGSVVSAVVAIVLMMELV